MLTVALVAVAAIAGLTGSWSPCGFSMIETIGRPRTRVLASCATFTLGALAGGAATFGAVAVAGAVLRRLVAGDVMLVAGAAVAVAAAVAELRGVRIAPQIRRQVPEHWRRTLPLPLAAALYGVLLGLAFTTFVLTFAVWALAGVTFAVGRPELGVAIGLAFGAGRALPIVTTAPIVHRRAGARVLAAMGERPVLLRAFRFADALALILAAAALVVVARADAATNIGAGADPSAANGVVVWTASGAGVEVTEGETGKTSVPAHAVVGGSMIAWPEGDVVHVAAAAGLAPVVDVTVPGVDGLAVSDQWLVTRAASAGGDTITARPLAAPDELQTIAVARRPAQLGRPAMDGAVLVFHVAGTRGSRIMEYNLSTSKTHVLRRTVSGLLTNPSVLAGQLLYVRQTDLAQLLELGGAYPGAGDHVLYRLGAPGVHDSGHEPGYSHKTRTPHPVVASSTLWTTALSAERAYVTLLPRRAGAQPRIVSVPR